MLENTNFCSDKPSLADAGAGVVSWSGSNKSALSRQSAANSIVAIGIAVDSDIQLHAQQLTNKTYKNNKTQPQNCRDYTASVQSVDRAKIIPLKDRDVNWLHFSIQV